MGEVMNRLWKGRRNGNMIDGGVGDVKLGIELLKRSIQQAIEMVNASTGYSCESFGSCAICGGVSN
jgi:hypothetical protein